MEHMGAQFTFFFFPVATIDLIFKRQNSSRLRKYALGYLILSIIFNTFCLEHLLRCYQKHTKMQTYNFIDHTEACCLISTQIK